MTPREKRTITQVSISAVRSEMVDLEEYFAPEWDDLYPDQQTDFEIE